MTSPDKGRGSLCLTLQIVMGVLISAVPLAYSPLAPLSLKWAIIGVVTPVIAFLWLWGGCGRPFRPLPNLVIPLLALMLVSEVSLFQAINLYYGLQMLSFVLVLFLLYLTVAYAFCQPDRQARLIRYLLLTLLAVSALSLYSYVTQSPFASTSPGQILHRLFGNRNYGAAYLLTVIPLSLALLLHAPRRGEKVLWGISLFFSVVVLTLSRVRGAWVGICIGFAVLVWVLFRRERAPGTLRTNIFLPLFLTGLLLGSAVLVAYALWAPGVPSLGERLATIFDPGTSSLQVRLAQWWGTLRMIGDHLWTGVGIGNFTFAYVPYRSPINYLDTSVRIEHPHNEYLALWSELGPLGLLAFLWLMVRVVRLGWRLASRPEDERGVLAGVLGGLTASAAYANFFYVFHVPASAMNLAILLGILDGMGRKVAKEERGFSLRLTCLLPGLLVISLLGFQYFLRPFAGEIHYFLAEKHFREKRMEAGLRHLERTLEWDPQSYVARYRRAAIFFMMGRYPETIREAEEALKIHPNMEVAYGIMGSAYLQLGDEARAKDIFVEAAVLNSNYPHALNNLGVLAVREGRIAAAEILFMKAKKILGRREMSPYANLGNLYEMAGRYREALKMYEAAVAIKPRFASNWYKLAQLRVRSGDPAGAYAPLARAIALDEAWRATAVQEPIFESLRQKDLRVRIILRLE
ncbi:MAG: O-antigen ligase family protein [Candidatus Methylomirabilales bacterium]